MAKKSAKAEQLEPERTFEESLLELQEVVQDLEGGALGLEESLSRFETGMQLLQACYMQLNQAEQKVELLTRITADGQVKTVPFDSTASIERDSEGTESDPRSDLKDSLF